MKLIELLAKELEKHGGWKEFASHCVQDSNYSVWFFRNGKPNFMAGTWADDVNSSGFDWEGSLFLSEKADDNSEAIISKEQYESALADLSETAPQQVESLAWSGDGMPPVGCECEYLDYNNQWYPVRVMYASEWLIVVRSLAEDGGKGVDIARRIHVETPSFRHIRTEAERGREAAVKAIMDVVHAGNGISCNLYEAIAAGKIPGVKLCE